ncbi:ankyrin repeat domain-containing protein [Providencia rettgeri]|uniref:ankyrin repeat domain-containing protein n=1 Tax=Providencia rettgeri TaxID=587 RepID=UPI0034E075AC
MPFSIQPALNSVDELSLAREGLSIYLQNHRLDISLCGGERWSKQTSKDDFWGFNAQKKDYILALLSQGAYHKGWQQILGVEKLNRAQLNALGIDADLLSDGSSGFQANICRYENLYILCFAGTNDIVDFYANIRQGLGQYEPQYFQAVGLANILFNSVNGKMICTGHSLGGGLASIAALASQSPGIAFSPAGLAKNTVNRIGLNYDVAEQLAGEGLIRFYTVQYDWLDSLQNTLPIPSALGTRIKMAYSEQSSWKNWLPHRLLTRSFIAHTMVKIIKVMCKQKPWNNWNAITGEYDKAVEIPLKLFPTVDEQQKTNWQECCESAIKKGNIVEFSNLLELDNKSGDLDFLAQQSARATNGQFMQVLLESSYGQAIKNTQLKQQKGILHLAAQSGRVMQSQILIENGFMVNITDGLGNTPLHDALNSHALDVAELLLANGADWRVKNKQGLDCKDIINHHIIKRDLLTPEGKKMRDKVMGMMS